MQSLGFILISTEKEQELNETCLSLARSLKAGCEESAKGSDDAADRTDNERVEQERVGGNVITHHLKKRVSHV